MWTEQKQNLKQTLIQNFSINEIHKYTPNCLNYFIGTTECGKYFINNFPAFCTANLAKCNKKMSC